MRLFKRHHLFKQHYYIEDELVEFWPDPRVQWHCLECGKIIRLKVGKLPVNPPRENQQQYYDRMVASGNAHLVMRPPLGTENEVRL